MMDYEVTLKLTDLCWQSDWNGYEISDCYKDVEVIGLYSNNVNGQERNYYIDMNKMELLDFWITEEDE